MDEFDPTLTDEELAEATAEELIDEEVPPRPAGFIVTENYYGAGTRPRIQLASGMPVGIWLDEPPRRNLTGAEVMGLLAGMGLDPEHAAWFARCRDKRLDGEREVTELPAVKGMIEYEAQREKDLKPIREAFVKAQQKKQK